MDCSGASTQKPSQLGQSGTKHFSISVMGLGLKGSHRQAAVWKLTAREGPPGRAGAVGAKRVGNVRDTGPSPPEGEAEPGPYSNLEEHTGEGQAGRRQQGAQNAGMGPATLPGAQAG